MQPELRKVDSPLTGIPKTSENLGNEESEIILQISHVYTSLEHIATHDAMNLSDSGRANIRRTQAQIQRLRLKLLDHFKNSKKGKE